MNNLVCWDSSVMIRHIGGDAHVAAAQQNNINSVVDMVQQGEYTMIISTVLYVEVVESTMPPQAMQIFDAFVMNRNIKSVAAGIHIAKKAQVLRNRIAMLTTPDAIHLATAIVAGARCFHTFDNGLLRLNGTDEVEGMAITKCEVPGMSLPLPLD